jgi:hypothetical protein
MEFIWMSSANSYEASCCPSWCTCQCKDYQTPRIHVFPRTRKRRRGSLFMISAQDNKSAIKKWWGDSLTADSFGIERKP